MSSGSFKSFTFEERLQIKRSYAVLGEPYGSPYDVCPHDFSPYMSPIEENVWHDIRCEIPQAFLFQYPCGKYFIDFSSPKLKVALEVDGRAYHQDERKDWLRDQYLLSHGYERVYHIPGFITFQELWPELDEDDDSQQSNDVVSCVTYDGGEAENDPGIMDPYQGSEFVERVTYLELIANLKFRARQALHNEYKNIRVRRVDSNGKPRRWVLASEVRESAQAYMKKAADACFCGNSWWRN